MKHEQLEFDFRQVKYGVEADKYLEDFYATGCAYTPQEKLDLLEFMVDGEFCYSHNPTVSQKVSMLEYELLASVGLIELTLV